MEHSKIPAPGQQTIGHAPLGSEQGFALVSLIALAPMLFALILALTCAFYVLKRKSLAQSHCVQQASLLQTDLKKTLDQLLQLNPKARTLRAQRQAADKGLKAAYSSLNPYAIAAAKAYWSAVYMQQLALRARQETLLRQAEVQRHAGHRGLRDRLRTLRVAAVDSRKYYWRALAVEAKPVASLTPDYETLPNFETLQQHRFKFNVDLRPPFADIMPKTSLKQTTECSVSLKGKEKQWKLQVVAANAPSKWSWF